MFVIVEQSWTPTTAKLAREVVIYLASSSKIFFLSFLAFQWPSPRGTPKNTYTAKILLRLEFRTLGGAQQLRG